MKASENPVVRPLVQVLKAGRERTRDFSPTKTPLVQFIVNPHYRWRVWVNVFQPSGVHQTAARTRLNRYPTIFSAVRDHFGDGAGKNILSFGCSTGEEVITLREYMSAARIVGAEINPRSLAICRKLGLDDKISFVRSDAKNISAKGPYDAIFCMAVLQRDPQLVVRSNVKSLAKVYTFEKFDRQIAEIDSYIKPGGILILHHAHYLLSDSSVGSRYAPLPSAAHLTEKYAKFGKDSEIISVEVPTNSIYQKLSN
ncbi:MAG: class I SAM-dependent methyltransferase [bacterium]